jgi:hypothetical protein
MQGVGVTVSYLLRQGAIEMKDENRKVWCPPGTYGREWFKEKERGDSQVSSLKNCFPVVLISS